MRPLLSGGAPRDRRRISGLLADTLPQADRERRVFAWALDDGMIDVLERAPRERMPVEIDRLKGRLEDKLGVREELALGVLRAAAHGLGLAPLPSVYTPSRATPRGRPVAVSPSSPAAVPPPKVSSVSVAPVAEALLEPRPNRLLPIVLSLAALVVVGGMAGLGWYLLQRIEAAEAIAGRAQARAADKVAAEKAAADKAAAEKAAVDRVAAERAAAERAAAEKAVADRARAASLAADCPGCPEMVTIPPGKFVQGAGPTEEEREGIPANFRGMAPQRLVTIAYPLMMSRYEVTREQFEVFVRESRYLMLSACATFGAGGSRTVLSILDWRNPGFVQTPRDPVVCVAWRDAMAYVEWLSRKTGKSYRLPSEAEWEYAARAGTSTGRYWDDDRGDACRYANVRDRRAAAAFGLDAAAAQQFACDDGHARTAPVGQFAANKFGLHDMLGNVAELVADCWMTGYSGAPADGGARDEADCASRIGRGGSWIGVPWTVRAAVRLPAGPTLRSVGLGFRVVRTN
ncbi:MAG: formylglycine-generating enzyme family protein [Reyranellaceae bacterium]